jgi:formate C-acetyltransferase
MRYFLGVMADSRYAFDRRLPEAEAVPFTSTLIGDCLSRGRDAYDVGAVYRLSGIYSVGIATVADSLAVIQDILEGENPLGLTLEDFVSEVRAGFVSNPRVRQWALSVPKYGNDLDDVDALAARCANDFCTEVLRLPAPDGALIWPILSSYIVNVCHGHVTAATPDGRLAGAPLSNTLSPSFGHDKCGPTATIRSACKIDFRKSVGGAVLNMRFLPSQLRNRSGKETLKGLLRTYIDLGGRQMQINCIDNATLRDAQANPSRYPNLLVRVSGFSARFVNLTRDVQDEIISRTELELV